MDPIELPSMHHVMDQIQRWQKETFPAATPEGAVRHLLEEVAEMAVEQDPIERAEEAADVFFMLVQFCALFEIDLTSEVLKKLEKNKARTWGKPDKDGVYYHTSEGL